MENNKKNCILHAYRPFLAFISVYKMENFRNIDDRRVFHRNNWRAVGATLLSLVNIWFVAVQLMVFVNCNFDLNVGGAQFSFVLCCAPAIFVHLLFIWNCGDVTAAIDYLQEIVLEREFHLKIILFFGFNF